MNHHIRSEALFTSKHRFTSLARVMPLGPSSFSPVSQALNFPGGMRLPSINSFLAMSNLGGNTNSHPPSNFSRDYNSTQERFIDLTADSSSPPRPTSFSASPIPDSDFLAFLRAEESTTSQTSGESASMTQRPASGLQEPSTKRRRLDSERSSPSRHISNSLRSGRRRDYINVDSLSNEVILDLTDVEGREALHKVQEEQRERHLALQEQQNQLVKESVQAQGQDKKGPFKLGQIQCVICMDNITDMTTTICGLQVSICSWLLANNC